MPENRPWDQVFDEVFPFHLSSQLPDENTKITLEQPLEKDDGGWGQVYDEVIGEIQPRKPLPELTTGDVAQATAKSVPIAGERLVAQVGNVLQFAANQRSEESWFSPSLSATMALKVWKKIQPEWHSRLEEAVRGFTKRIGEKTSRYWNEAANKGIFAQSTDVQEIQAAGMAGWKHAPVTRALTGTIESSGTFAAGVTAGIITKNPMIGAIVMGVLGGSGTYTDLIDNDVSQNIAQNLGVVAGAWEASTELAFGPLDDIIKGSAKSALRRFMVGGGRESFQEWIQGMGENIITHFGYNVKDWKSIPKALKEGIAHTFDNWLDNVTAGFLMGGPASAGFGGQRQKKLFKSKKVNTELEKASTIEDPRKRSLEVNRIFDEAIANGTISEAERIRFRTNLTSEQIKQVLKLPSEARDRAIWNFEFKNIKLTQQEAQQEKAYGNIGEEVSVKIEEDKLQAEEKTSSTVSPETIEDLIKRGQPDAVEEAQKGAVPGPLQQTEDDTTPTGSPYTLVETQSGIEIHDKQTGRIVEHFDNSDKTADKRAAKRLNKMNSDPKAAAKYDKSTNGQKARISILGKRLGLIDKKGKVKPAFRRFLKGTTGKTSRKALTWGEAKRAITAMEKHRPTFRVKDKVTPTGQDVVGEVIHLNTKRGLATVQFKNRVTGDVSSRIFNLSELAAIGEVQTASEELIETIRETQKIQTPEERIFGQKENRLLKKHWQNVKRYVTGWHHSLIRVNRMMEWLDGHEKGPNWNRIFRPMYQASLEAEDAINQRFGDVQKFMLDTFGPEGTKELLTGKQTPVIDVDYKNKISLSPAERIGYYVLSQNKDGLRRIKRGNLGSFGNKEAALKSILDSVTKQEKQLGDWALQQLEAQYPRANQAAIIALGRELTPADNYFPMYAPTETKDLEQQFDFLTALEEKVGTPKTPIEIAETKERVPTATGPVETDFFRSYFHNFTRVEQFINMAPAVNEVQNLLNNKEYRHILNKATNGYGVKVIHNWMKDTTKGKSTEINNWMGKTLMGLRTNAMIYAIGYNIPSVMRQPLSLGNAIALDPLMLKYVPINWMKNKQSWDNYRAMENEVMGKSIMMRNRDFDRVQSTLNNLSAMEKRILGKKTYSRKAISWIKWTDRHTTILVWKSLYDVALERNLNEEQAIAFADDGVSKTQPMGNARDLPDFFRGGALEKLFSTFQNQVNNNYNFWTHDIIGELKAGKISKRTAAYRVMFSYVIPALLFGMIGRGGPPDEWTDVVKDLALYPLGALFLVGRVVTNAAKGFAGGGTSVAEIGISELEKTIAAGFKGDIKQVALHGTKAVGALTGRIPAQVIRTGEGAYDLAQNETDDWRRLIYSKWSLSQGDRGDTIPTGHKRKLKRRTTRKRKLRKR